jgi:hypothetical protein
MVRVKVGEAMHKAVAKITFDAAVAKLKARVIGLRDWKVNSSEFPVLDITFGASKPDTAQRIRFSFDEWNDLPPSITFLSAAGEPLKTVKGDPKGVINVNAHPITGLPFICSIGSREYHTHSSHTSDLWENYKDKPGFDIGSIVTKVWNAWKKSI